MGLYRWGGGDSNGFAVGLFRKIDVNAVITTILYANYKGLD